MEDRQQRNRTENRQIKRRRQRRRRRVKRMLKVWMARILVFSVLTVLCFGVIHIAVKLYGYYMGTEGAFQSAETDKPVQRKPGSRLIVVDAGHGGQDPGTSAGEILEKDINLAMAEKLAKILDDAGETVILTRGDDTKIELEERAKFANRNDADLFISLHCNYCEDDAEVEGLECYYREDSEEGKALADRIIQSVEDEENIVNRGTRTANFRVLCKTDMPAVLVEMGYLSNPSEQKKMTNDKYQQLLAEKIAEGIL